MVCKHSETVFRAFTLPISLRTDAGGYTVSLLSGHFEVPAKPCSIAKKKCNVLEDNGNFSPTPPPNIKQHSVGNRVPE